MAIAREELIEGGRCLYRTRLAYGSGGSTAIKLRQAKVLKVGGGVADIKLLDNGREIKVPFAQLEPDEEWLDEHDRKEEQKKKRIEQERIASEQLAAASSTTSTTQPLTQSLGDKLRAVVEPPALPCDGVPLSQADLDRLAKMRRDAIEQLDQLKAPKPEHIATVHALRPQQSDTEPDVPAQVPLPMPEPTPKPPTRPPLTVPPSQPPQRIPEPEPAQPEPEPEPVIPAEPVRIAPAAAAPPLDPLQALLRSVQSEFEKLIGDEARIEQRTATTARLIARLTARQAADAAQLDANRARQRVLTAQERQLLALAKLAPPAPPVTSAPAPEKAPAPAPAQTPATRTPIAAPERGLDGSQTGGELLRTHETREAARDVVSRQQKAASKPAVSASAVAGAQGDWVRAAPGWMRRSKPGAISEAISEAITEPRRTWPEPAQRRGGKRGPARIDLSDPLEKAIEEIAKRKEGRA